MCYTGRGEGIVAGCTAEVFMETQVVKTGGDRLEEAVARQAGQIIKDGGLVAFPTETVYGLGGDALNPGSSRKIYEAKGRPSDNPLIVHICRWEDIYRIADPVPQAGCRLASAFWPSDTRTTSFIQVS